MAGTEQQRFPDPGFQSGEYSVEWKIGETRLAGELTLAPRRLPSVAVYGDIGLAADSIQQAFPRDLELARLTGRLRSNHDVVIVDARLQEWFPEHTIGGGRWAVVGLDVCDVPEDRYDQVALQITDSDLLFGAPPLKAITWPRGRQRGSSSTTRRRRASGRIPGKTFSASINTRAQRIWRDASAGVKLDCGYLWQTSVDPYRFGVTAAPVIDVTAKTPLRLDEWRDQWIAPLLGLASFATKKPQTVSWLRVRRRLGRRTVHGTVFSGGLDQEPFTARFETEWRIDPERRPLFTFASLEGDAIQLIEGWRALEASDNPFVELYRIALFQPGLPPRARFLYLVQALEALHAYEHQSADERRQRDFAARREELIDEARVSGMSSASVCFLKNKWNKRAPDSLDRRLSSLMKALPASIQTQLSSGAELDPIREALERDDEARTFPAQLRVLRNHLSHGDRSYDDSDLRPWVGSLETLCRGHLMRLLGFDWRAIEVALHYQQ